MSYDGIVTRAMVQQLNDKFQGAKIQRIIQPEKDQIHLQLYHLRRLYRILLSCSDQYPGIYEIDYKAKQDEAPGNFCMYLRRHLQGGTIASIEQKGMDRVVLIHIDTINELGNRDNKCLILEIMGRHSNIILTDENHTTVLESAIHVNHRMSRLREIYPGSKYFFILDEKIDIKKESPRIIETLKSAPQNQSLRKFIYSNYTGFSPLISSEIAWRADIDESRPISSLNENEREQYAEAFENIIADILNSNWSYAVYSNQDGKLLDFHVLPLEYYGDNKKEYHDPSQMISDYYLQGQKKNYLNQRGSDLQKRVNKLLEKEEKKLYRFQEELKEASNREEHKIMADLIAANQHQIERGATEITVQNFYDPENKWITIPLDPTRSPWSNAQRHYKKYSKLKTAEKLLKRKIPKTKSTIDYLNQVNYTLSFVTEKEELDEIRSELEEAGLIKKKAKHKQKKVNSTSSPLQFVSSDNLPIYVGKNNRQNDYVTMKLAKQDDLFFHIKDMPGPHVILKCSGQKVSEESIYEAAQLAALFSNQNLNKIPIDYTERKNVKKPGGAKPGMVYYENYTTLQIEPDKRYLEKLQKKDS